MIALYLLVSLVDLGIDIFETSGDGAILNDR